MRTSLHVLRSYQFPAEILVGFYLVAAVSALFGYSLTVLFYLAAAIGFTAVLILLSKLLYSVFAYTAAAVIYSGILLFLGTPIIVGLTISGYTCWRFVRHLQEEDLENEYVLLLTAVFACFIDLFFLQGNRFILVAALQASVTAGGYFLKNHWMAFGNKQLLLRMAGLLTAILLAVGGISWSLLQLIRGLLTLAVDGLGIGGNLLRPLLERFDNDLQLSAQQQEMLSSQTSSDNGQENDVPTEGTTYSEETAVPYLYLALLAGTFLIILFLLVYFYRKRKAIVSEDAPEKPMRASGVMQETKITGLSKSWSKRPNEPIRKQIYDLEKHAVKFNRGRKASETIEEWFEREGFPLELAEVYKQIRYGTDSLSKEEIKRYEAAFAALKKQGF